MRFSLSSASDKLRTMRRAVLAAMILTSACSARGPEPAPVPADHAATVQAWRDKHEVDYRRDWVSIAGLYFLSPGSHTIGSDPKSQIVLGPHAAPRLGTVVAGADGSVRFEAAPTIVVTQKDAVVKGPIVMKEAGKPPAPRFSKVARPEPFRFDAGPTVTVLTV